MLNKVILMGHVGQTPSEKVLTSGKKMVTFSVATSEKWKDRETGERKEKTEWHRIVVFHEDIIAVVEKYVEKGTKLFIDGTLTTRKWTDKDGIDRYAAEIVLSSPRHRLVLLGKSDGGSHNTPPDTAYEE